VSGPLEVALRVSRCNRGSLAAVMAVLEAELPGGTARFRLVEDLDAYDGRGLLLYSFMTAQAAAVAGELEGLRRRLGPDLLTLAGGPHATGDPEGALALGFRWVAPGEAGPEVAELVLEVAGERARAPGIVRVSRRQPLDRYPPWPRSGELFCAVEITRGCPVGCAFCQTPALHGRRPRHRSLAELERVFAHAVATGHTYTRFVTPNAFAYGSPDGSTPNPRGVEAVLTLARRAGFQRLYLGSFPSEVRPESVTEDTVGLVRGLADNRSVVVGLQSGSPEVLHRIRRGHTVEQGVRAVATIARAGLRPRVDFILGLPGESPADRVRSLELMAHLAGEYGAHVNVHCFTPLPGTPLASSEPSPIEPRAVDLLERLTGRGQASGLLRHGVVGRASGEAL